MKILRGILLVSVALSAGQAFAAGAPRGGSRSVESRRDNVAVAEP